MLAKQTQVCLFPQCKLNRRLCCVDEERDHGSELSFVLMGQEGFATKGDSANKSFGCLLGEADVGLSPNSLYIECLLC